LIFPAEFSIFTVSIVFFVAKEKRPMWSLSEQYKRWICGFRGK